MDKDKFVTFRLTYGDFQTLVSMLEKSRYSYNLGERNILENFRNILKKL